LNEIVAQAPGTDRATGCEYVEFRGAPNSTIQNLTYLDVEGDGANAGRINYIRNLNGATFGSNGLLVISANAEPTSAVPNPQPCRVFDPASSVILDPNFLVARPPASTVFINKATDNNGTNSFVLVSGSVSGLIAGNDIDANNDGVLDGGLNISDGVAVRDSDGGLTYGVVLPRPSGIPAGEAINAATRFPTDLRQNESGAFISATFRDRLRQPINTPIWQPAEASISLRADA